MNQFPEHLTARERLIVALDFPSAAAALRHADELRGECLWFKVGLELFIAAGPAIVATLRDRGLRVFLDLKLYDIPNTVASAVRATAGCGASLLSLHASGGPAMLRAAADAAACTPDSPRLLAVTVLTSMDAAQLRSVGISDGAGEQVSMLAQMARAEGVADFVCSAHEAPGLRRLLGPKSLLVVPGIRPAGSLPDDQQRIATPATALADGASLLVVGRPITQSPDPRAAARAILAEMERS